MNYQEIFNEWKELNPAKTFIEYWVEKTGNKMGGPEFQKVMNWIVSNQYNN